MSTIERKEYEALLAPLQEELVAMARWLQRSGKRVVVLFEGRDTAGKGRDQPVRPQLVQPRRGRDGDGLRQLGAGYRLPESRS